MAATQSEMKLQIDQQKQQIENLVKQLQEKTTKEANSGASYKQKYVVKCHHCHEEGHIRPNCPKFTDAEKIRKDNNKEVVRSARKAGRRAFRARKIDKSFFVEIKIGIGSHKCLVDSGSEVTLLSYKIGKLMTLRPTDKVLYAANGTKIQMSGEVNVIIQIAGMEIETFFYVSEQIA